MGDVLEVIVVAEDEGGGSYHPTGNPWDDTPTGEKDEHDLPPIEEIIVIAPTDPGGDDGPQPGGTVATGASVLLTKLAGWAELGIAATLAAVDLASWGPLGPRHPSIGATPASDFAEDVLNAGGLHDSLYPDSSAYVDSLADSIGLEDTPFWATLAGAGVECLADPPRSDYRESVVHPIDDPYDLDVPLGGLDDRQLLVEAGFEMLLLSKAMLLAEERRQGAELAGDARWAAHHEESVVFYGEEFAVLVDRVGVDSSPARALASFRAIRESPMYPSLPSGARRAVRQAEGLLLDAAEFGV